MRFRKTLLASVTAALGCLWAAPPATAQPLTPLSEDHTRSGVSQLTAMAVRNTPNSDYALRLINPTKRGHIAAALFYERRGGNTEQGSDGVFIGCFVRNLPLHASVNVGNDLLPSPTVGFKRYAEILAVPRGAVVVGGQNTRVANGLGIIATSAGRHRSHQLNPMLFELPFDQAVPGQRQAAIDCICDGLSAQGFPTDAFSEADVICP